MKICMLFSSVLLSGTILSAQTLQDAAKLTEVWKPEPPVVTPGRTAADPPSDAIVLFDGTDLRHWEGMKGEAAGWTIADKAMTVKPGTGDIRTKLSFGSCQLHIEWRSPAVVKGEGQGRGNSGVFLMGKYEIQVLDSYENKTYVNGQAASLYKQQMPLVNASRPPGEWQTYDIFFTAPEFYTDGRLKSPARVTVIHNGVLVQHNTAIWGSTEYIGIPRYLRHEDKLPIKLQDHGDLVSFRNIWIREL